MPVAVPLSSINTQNCLTKGVRQSPEQKSGSSVTPKSMVIRPHYNDQYLTSGSRHRLPGKPKLRKTHCFTSVHTRSGLSLPDLTLLLMTPVPTDRLLILAQDSPDPDNPEQRYSNTMSKKPPDSHTGSTEPLTPEGWLLHVCTNPESSRY